MKCNNLIERHHPGSFPTQEQWIGWGPLGTAEHSRELSKWETKLPFVCTSWSNFNSDASMKHAALPPLRLRASEGLTDESARTTIATVLWYLIYDVSKHPQQLASLWALSDVHATQGLEFCYLLCGQMAITFDVQSFGMRRKHVFPRSW